MSETAFIVCRIGDKGSSDRVWADDVYNFIVVPAIEPYDLKPVRSDKERTPGIVTTQIVKGIDSARVVVADLTGRNPNVYYELAIAQTLGKPVVILVDDVDSLSFDVKGERAIPIGPSGGGLRVRDAKVAEEELRAALKEVLAPEYRPHSVISEAANSRQLDALASGDPKAQELADLRDNVEYLSREVRALNAKMPLSSLELLNAKIAPRPRTELLRVTGDKQLGTVELLVEEVAEEPGYKVTVSGPNFGPMDTFLTDSPDPKSALAILRQIVEPRDDGAS